MFYLFLTIWTAEMEGFINVIRHRDENEINAVFEALKNQCSGGAVNAMFW